MQKKLGSRLLNAKNARFGTRLAPDEARPDRQGASFAIQHPLGSPLQKKMTRFITSMIWRALPAHATTTATDMFRDRKYAVDLTRHVLP